VLGGDGEGFCLDFDPVTVDHLIDLAQDLGPILRRDIFNVQTLFTLAYQTQSDRLAVYLEGSVI
jgi:hypothetical protein